jgi:hypothetical protein
MHAVKAINPDLYSQAKIREIIFNRQFVNPKPLIMNRCEYQNGEKGEHSSKQH